MTAFVRLAARLVLTLLMLGSFAIAGRNAWLLARSPYVTWMVERSSVEIEARLDAVLATHATPEQIDARLRALLAAEPREWARIEAVEELAEARAIVPTPEVAEALAAARAEDFAFTRLAVECAACTWDFEACTLTTLLSCRGPVELTPLGDLASVARELNHMARGEEVDDLDLALSTVGLGAVVIAPLVGGSSLSLKLGATLTRLAYRTGALSVGVIAEGRRVFARAIDWDLLARSSPGRLLDDLGRAVDPRAFAPVAEFLRHVDTVRASVGTRRALLMLRHLDDPKDARKLAAVTTAAGRKAPGALEMLGTKRFLRLALRLSDEAISLAIAGTSAFVTFVALLCALAKALGLRILRRLAREPGRGAGRASGSG